MMLQGQRCVSKPQASSPHLPIHAGGAKPLRNGRRTAHGRLAFTPSATNNEPSQFDVGDKRTPPATSPLAQGEGETAETPRDDDVLPEDLADALSQAASATAEAIKRGNARCQVELLLPTFWDPISGPIFPNKGDQERFWRITRRFVDELGDSVLEGGTSKTVNAVYPDSGVAAMLSYQWKDDGRFRVSSLNDRKPIQPEDELVVVVAPDPPGADECLNMIKQINAKELEDGLPQKPVVLFNQRLASGDVGLGLNVRRMRNTILKDFAVTYSLRPLGLGDLGTVYRRFPGMWQVFLQDPELPGRYRLVAEKPSRPEGEYLDYLVQQAMGGFAEEGKEGEHRGGGFLGQLRHTANSLNYFMKSLSK